VSVKSVAVTTGKPGPEKAHRLETGVLEVSADGTTFAKLAEFANGEVSGDPSAARIRAVRIRPPAEQEHPLTIREFKIVSDPPVSTFKLPVEIEVDCADSPEMKAWAEKVGRLCEQGYPRLNEALKSDGYIPPHYIKVQITAAYPGVAATHGANIVGSTKYFKSRPNDVGAMIHETVHVIQHYPNRVNPGWLVEGMADYVRFFVFEPGKIGPTNVQRARYNGSYRTTAAFLAFVNDKYDKSLVPKLNARMRAGTYNDGIFKELTGKTVQQLDEEWRESLSR
jgi:hypothetical protein